MPVYTHPKQPTSSALLAVVNCPSSLPPPSLWTAQCNGQESLTIKPKALFLINTKTALLKVNHMEHQTQTMSVRDWMWCQGSWVRSAMGASQTLVSFAHCTLRVIKAVDMNYNSAGMWEKLPLHYYDHVRDCSVQCVNGTRNLKHWHTVYLCVRYTNV